MKYDFKHMDDALASLKKEADRLGINFSVEDFQRERAWLEMKSPPSMRCYTRDENRRAWGHSVSVEIEVVVIESKFACSCGVSWSATTRSVSMAVAAIGLYQRATEFAAFAECILTGIKVVVVEEKSPDGISTEGANA